MSEENKTLDFFNQAIADGLNELGYSVDIPNEKGEMKFGPECHEVCTIAEKLNKLIESWPVVYAENVHLPWHTESFQGATRQARLAFIEEIKKESCRHEPLEVEVAVGPYTTSIAFDYSTDSICKHCGAPLKAKWEAVNE